MKRSIQPIRIERRWRDERSVCEGPACSRLSNSSQSIVQGAPDRREGRPPPGDPCVVRQENTDVVARGFILVQLLLALLLSGCATHEMVLSRTLRPALSREDIDFQMTLFRARVQMDRLEVWGRVKRSESDYSAIFDIEIQSAAALCAALTNSGLIFESDWRELDLRLANEYGSQWQWRTAHGHTIVRISRETLVELRKRNAPASAYPQYWHLLAYKVGPPDYVPYEWSSTDVRTNSGQDGR